MRLFLLGAVAMVILNDAAALKCWGNEDSKDGSKTVEPCTVMMLKLVVSILERKVSDLMQNGVHGITA